MLFSLVWSVSLTNGISSVAFQQSGQGQSFNLCSPVIFYFLIRLTVLTACPGSLKPIPTQSWDPTNISSLSLCLSVYVSFYLSIDIYIIYYLSFYLSIFLSIYLSIYLYIYLSFYISFYISIYLSIYLSFSLSLFPSFKVVLTQTCTASA